MLMWVLIHLVADIKVLIISSSNATRITSERELLYRKNTCQGSAAVWKHLVLQCCDATCKTKLPLLFSITAMSLSVLFLLHHTKLAIIRFVITFRTHPAFDFILWNMNIINSLSLSYRYSSHHFELKKKENEIELVKVRVLKSLLLLSDTKCWNWTPCPQMLSSSYGKLYHING